MADHDDFHIHATRYRRRENLEAPGGATVAEQIAAARSNGTRRVGIVEHCNASPRHPWPCLEELRTEFEAVADPECFRGVEADLLPGGLDSCTIRGRELLKLDYVIGSVHLGPPDPAGFSVYLGEEFVRLAAAAEHNPNIDVIGHPFISGLRYAAAGAVPRWSFDLVPLPWQETLLDLCRRHGKAIELNCRDISEPGWLAFLDRVRRSGVRYSIGSDAHDTGRQKFAAGLWRLVEDMGLDPELQWYPGKW